MSSDRGGLLKTRTEAFARHLQTRLKSLGDSEDGNWGSEVSSDSEVFYDLESPPASPEEEEAEPFFVAAQNRDSLPLQRSESSSSQYFDTVENIEDHPPSPVSSVPILKQIPILHLKTDRPATITNGYTNLIDADSGCSRVHEMPSVELESGVKETEIENHCDNNSVLDNNNTEKEDKENSEESSEAKLCIVNDCDKVILQVDTSEVGEESPPEYAEEASESFCVFCDIEQIKSSLSNCCTEVVPSQDKDMRNGYCEAEEVETNLESQQVSGILETEDVKECVSEDDENIPLTDLLQVLKLEITNETKQSITERKEAECGESLESDCPSIEITDSSSSDTKAKVKEDEVFDIETKRKNFRRCSSLKSGKTPPSTPGRKKIVRFADVLGLDLADVKTFLDEVPTVPKSAFQDLQGIELSSSPVVESPLSRIVVVTPQPEKVLMPLFQQPCVQPNFLDRVRENNICLESAYVSDMVLFAVAGLVRVKNIDFHKSVYVRYSIDRWHSFSDLQARYVPNSCDGFSDKFTFVIYAHTLKIGQRLEFAVRFHSAGSQFWDSNGGQNYCFECISQNRSTSHNHVEACSSFY